MHGNSEYTLFVDAVQSKLSLHTPLTLTHLFSQHFFNMSGEACGIDHIKNNCPGITEAGAIINTFSLTCLCPDTTSLKRKNQCFSHPGTPKVRGELYTQFSTFIFVLA